jgi:hypothetical protein
MPGSHGKPTTVGHAKEIEEMAEPNGRGCVSYFGCEGSKTPVGRHSSMIGRVWHGWTTHANADAFETYVRNEIWPGILARNIKGLHELQCLRLDRPGHTEFKTLMRFESIEAVQEFAGQDYTKAVVPPRARALLRRYDDRAEHFEVCEIVAANATVPVQGRMRQSA